MSNFSSFVPSAGGGADLQEFTTSGTWTKPAGATFVMVEAWGGGGGGGSGRRGGADRVGGGGAGGGAYSYRLFKASQLAPTESVTIGAGGAGGLAVTINNSNGVNGSLGGNTLFGSVFTSFGGNAGSGGSTTTSAGGSGGGVLGVGGVPLAGAFGGGLANPNNPGSASGFGGGGGGSNTVSTAYFGGSSYQGGGGGGGGANLRSNLAPQVSGSGGGISGSGGTGAAGVIYPGIVGNAGTGTEGGAGGASSHASLIVVNNEAMVFGNSTFAASSVDGQIATSANGTTGWNFQTNPLNSSTPWILHDGTQFVLFDSRAKRCWKTTNFTTYTEATGLPSEVQITVTRVRYANGNYFVLGNNAQIWSSSDLVTWTQVNSGNGNFGNINDICWSGSNYVAVSANSPRVRYSSDLTTWSTPATGGTNSSYSCESNGSGTVVIQTNVTPFAERSTDHGVNFTNVATTLLTGGGYRALLFANSTWIATSSSNLWTSTDGNTWTSRISSGDSFQGIAWDGTTFVAGSGAFNAVVARTAVPADLGSWTNRSVAPINVNAGAGGAGGPISGGGGGGGASLDGYNSGAGGAGGNGFCRVYTW